VVNYYTEEERGIFQPILGHTHLLLITHGTDFAKEMAIVQDEKSDDNNGDTMMEEVNAVLTNNLNQQMQEDEGENDEQMWHFDTCATVHITHNNRNLCISEIIQQMIKVAEGQLPSLMSAAILFGKLPVVER
jgi:hypothetical protein